jgi:hypothetical protein
LPRLIATATLQFGCSKKAQKVKRILATAGVFCCLLVCAGCSGSANAIATKLAGPRIDWSMSLLANGGNGIGQFPAKFTFDINAPVSAANCTSDFVAYNTGVAGAPGVAKIVAYNSLYATQGSAGGLCNTDGPSVYWAYDTDTTGSSQSLTSPVLSIDGSKIAFIDNYASGVLRIIKWKANQGTGVGSPATPDQDISGMSWSACTAGNSCIASIAFSGGTNDTNSPPFYNYSTDVLYAGDNSGGLHKFTGMFNGTPAEVTTGGWPLEVHSGSALTGPVFDSVSGNIYIGDSTGLLSMIREVSSSVGTCTAPCVNSTQSVGTGGEIVDPPIVDGTNGYVFAVNGTETSNGGALVQASTDFATSSQFNIGSSSGGVAEIYGGAFDSTYLNSSAGNISGHMYICGHQYSGGNKPAMYQASFNTNGTISSLAALNSLEQGTGGGACSPVTEVYNTATATDWIFFSVGAHVRTSGSPIPAGSCRTDGAGCVIGVNVTGNPSWPPTNVTSTASVPTNNAGATSGIVVDNVSTGSQASNIYFSLGGNSTGSGPGLPSCNTTAGVGCAVKLTQSTLQ